MKYPLLFFILSFWFTNLLNAQIEASGSVIDSSTSEILPFVNIIAKPNNEGTTTDHTGNFKFIVPNNTTELQFSYLGYKTYSYKLQKNTKDIHILMSSTDIKVQEAVVKVKRKKRNIVKDTIAMSLQRLVVENKEKNRPKSFNSYQYNEHSKLEVSYYKPSPKFTKRKIFKPFRVIYDYIDTTESGAPYLPLLLQEKYSSVYYQSEPKKKKTIIKGQYLSGIDNLSVSQIVDDVFKPIDLYDNIIIAGGKSFLSPFSKTGLGTYRYYIKDTLKVEDHTVYEIMFTPKSKESIAFNGFAYIDSASYAIQFIHLGVPKQTNVNFVGDLSIEQEFKEIEKRKWIKENEQMRVAINVLGKKNSRSLLLHQKTFRDDIIVNQDIPETFFNGEALEISDSIQSRDKNWWLTHRIDSLSPQEAGVSVMIDSVKRTRAYKNYNWLFRVFSTGYLKTGPVEFGKFYQFISWNNIEGIRPKMGLRTNSLLSERIQLNAYLAYGTKDKVFKPYFNTRIFLPRKNNNWHLLELTYQKDFTFLGQDFQEQQFSPDNIFLALIRTSPLSKIILTERLNINYERQWFQGYTTRVSFGPSTYFAIKDVFEFNRTNPDGTKTSYDKFGITELRIDQHFGFGQKFIENNFNRFEGYSFYPVFDLKYRLGIKNFAGGDFNYHRLEGVYKHRLSSKIGYTSIYVAGGKIFGKLPYPLLFIPVGNPNIYINPNAFQLMREFEYVADAYVQARIEHHFDGFLLNKIPLINKLKLRTSFYGAIYAGNITKTNQHFIDLPEGTKPSDNFFAEVGFSIENILNIGKVMFVWRLTQRDQPNIQKFGVKFQLSPKL